MTSVGSIEEEILERVKQKMGINAKVIQADLFNDTSTAQFKLVHFPFKSNQYLGKSSQRLEVDFFPTMLYQRLG